MKKLLSVLLGAGLLLTSVAEAKGTVSARSSFSSSRSSSFSKSTSSGFKVYSAKSMTSGMPKVGVSAIKPAAKPTALMPVSKMPTQAKPVPMVKSSTPSTKPDATFTKPGSIQPTTPTPRPVVINRTEYRERDSGYGDMLMGAAGGYLLAKALEPTPAQAQPQPIQQTAPVETVKQTETVQPQSVASVEPVKVQQPMYIEQAATQQEMIPQPQMADYVPNIANSAIAVPVPEFKGGVDGESTKIFSSRKYDLYCIQGVMHIDNNNGDIPLQPLIGRNGLPTPCQLKP